MVRSSVHLRKILEGKKKLTFVLRRNIQLSELFREGPILTPRMDSLSQRAFSVRVQGELTGILTVQKSVELIQRGILLPFFSSHDSHCSCQKL